MADQMQRFFQIETKAGDPIRAGEVDIIPFSRALVVRLPFFPGGLVWNRPSAVAVAGPGAVEERIIPIQDVTRRIQWSILGGGLVGGLLMLLLSQRKR